LHYLKKDIVVKTAVLTIFEIPYSEVANSTLIIHTTPLDNHLVLVDSFLSHLPTNPKWYETKVYLRWTTSRIGATHTWVQHIQVLWLSTVDLYLAVVGHHVWDGGDLMHFKRSAYLNPEAARGRCIRMWMRKLKPSFQTNEYSVYLEPHGHTVTTRQSSRVTVQTTIHCHLDVLWLIVLIFI